MLERTAPDLSLDPLDALYATLSEFIDFVSQNRYGYVSLLRGAASGDARMRTVFDDTRTEIANRTLSQTPVLGIPTGPRTRLAVRGWIAFTEDVVISWLSDEELPRDELVRLISGACPRCCRTPPPSSSRITAAASSPAPMPPACWPVR